MVNKILAAFVAADILFATTGAIMMGFSIIARKNRNEIPVEGTQAARDLIYQTFPFDAGIANACFIFVTFILTLPGIVTPTRGWLKLAGWVTAITATFTLVIGVYLWVLTLRTQTLFLNIWTRSPANVQSLMQTSFNCCGYFNSTSPAFVTDGVCTSPASAALLRGCLGPVTSFANVFLDTIFTSVFGMVGIDALLILTITMLLKDRKERERYRHIDAKSGSGSL